MRVVCSLASSLAITALAACYSTPQPDCGFLCGPAGECPDNYQCGSDNVCHRAGSPASLVCGVDAAVDSPRPDADVTPPTLTSSTPAANATGVAASSAITIVFSEPVIGVDTSTFRVDAAGSAIGGPVTSSSPTTYTFTPSAPLTANATITVTLLAGIHDGAGNVLAPAPTTFSFQTAP